MWPIQLAFLRFTVCIMFLFSLTIRNTSFFTWSVQWTFPYFSRPHFNTLKAFIIYFSKCPRFSIIQSSAPNIAFTFFLQIEVQFAVQNSLLPAKCRFCHSNPGFDFTVYHIIIIRATDKENDVGCACSTYGRYENSTEYRIQFKVAKPRMMGTETFCFHTQW